MALQTLSLSSKTSARHWPSSWRSFSPALRSLSSFGKQRFSPVVMRPTSSASAPSPHSFTSSSKACLKTRTSVFCCSKLSKFSLSARCVFSQWRGRSPVRTAGGFVNFGRLVTNSATPFKDNSRSFFSCSSRSLLERSSSRAWAACARSSLSFFIWRSCSSESFAFSPQLLLIICSISFSCRSNFCLSASRSSSVRVPPAPPPVPPAASFFFSSSTSAFSREICEASSFFVAETLMALARFA
mmetsp:Transcript_47172/g.84940  ORF Transcript_47172/g.84940 Transcript_47172/m.84940 type:complete len:242 (-) Transcript_47172:1084-1809(-)